MAVDLTLLPTLKEKVRTATTFSDAMTYFFDHFGDLPDFLALGERVLDPFLEQVIHQVGQQVYPKGARVSNLLLTRIKEQSFIHGGFLMNGSLGNIIFFEDIRLGLMAVVTSLHPSETKFMRFSGKPVHNSWLRSDN